MAKKRTATEIRRDLETRLTVVIEQERKEHEERILRIGWLLFPGDDRMTRKPITELITLANIYRVKNPVPGLEMLREIVNSRLTEARGKTVKRDIKKSSREAAGKVSQEPITKKNQGGDSNG